MADSVKGFGRLLQGDQFEFSLDGISTSAQLERLIRLTEQSIKGSGNNDQPHKRFIAATNAAANKVKESEQATSAEATARNRNTRTLEQNTLRVESAFRSLVHGNFRGALEAFESRSSRFAIVLSAFIGALTGYNDKLAAGLKQGVSGSIFDLAISAKNAGVNIEQFTKSLSESGGSFASLGEGATDGARNFSRLVSSVREATKSVGNLGMNNEELSMFTAKQTKLAVMQGFKGKQAQDLVIKNSRALADELDMLAFRTGKSVLELSEAAIKLAQDPLVSVFVKTARTNGESISKSVQIFASSLRGVFGEAGDTLASDALKSAMSGLPLAMTQAGKNLMLGSTSLYSELERQGLKVKQGAAITEEDQKKLRDIVLKEVQVRGDELRRLSMLEGPLADSAKQMLLLAQQAELYNGEVGKERRNRERTAQEFNSSIRDFQANLQALAVPFLKIINGIDWGTFISVFSSVIGTINTVFGSINDIFSKIANIIGVDVTNVLGKVVGGLVGFVALIGLANVAITTTKGIYTGLSTTLTLFRTELIRTIATMRGGAGSLPTVPAAPAASKWAKGVGMASGIGVGLLAGAGSEGGLTSGEGVGSVVGGVAGALAGPMIGRLAGSVLGSFAGPIGTMIGSTLGATAGGAIGKWLSSSSSTNAGVELGKVSSINNQPEWATKMLALQTQGNKHFESMIELSEASLGVGIRSNAVQRDNVYATKQTTIAVQNAALT